MFLLHRLAPNASQSGTSLLVVDEDTHTNDAHMQCLRDGLLLCASQHWAVHEFEGGGKLWSRKDRQAGSTPSAAHVTVSRQSGTDLLSGSTTRDRNSTAPGIPRGASCPQPRKRPELESSATRNLSTSSPRGFILSYRQGRHGDAALRGL